MMGDAETVIKGQLRKKVPFFNPEDENYNDYTNSSLESFSTNLSEYLERDEDDYITNLFDLLIAPHYVIDKKNDPEFGYSSGLMELFYLLYPSSERFSHFLNSELLRIEKNIKNQTEDPNKDKILGKLNSVKKNLDGVFAKLEQNIKSQPDYAYVQASLETINKMNEFIEGTICEVRATPPQIISHNYYVKNPDESWIENPLAFFLNLIFNTGLDLIKSQKEQDFQRFGKSNPIAIYIQRRLTGETHQSLSYISEKLATFKLKDRKRYLETLCEGINILYEKSEHHEISGLCSEYQWPYKKIMTDLKIKNPDLLIDVSFDYMVEYEIPFYEKDEYINSLFSLELKDIEWNSFKLFIPANKDTLKLFVRGEIEDLPVLELGWTIEQFYYFLAKAIENGLPIIPGKLENKIQYTYRSQTLFFKVNNFKQFPQHLKNRTVLQSTLHT